MQRPSTREVLGELLSEPRRRRVVSELDDADGAVTVSELAGRVAEVETDGDAVSDVETVEVDLYHSQVPKLADAGIVAFDREATDVALAVSPETVDRALALLDQAVDDTDGAVGTADEPVTRGST